jgi:septum site-determining protein MinC
VLRGTSSGLEFVFADGNFEAAWAEMAERLAERPDFYRGSSATAVFDGAPPDDATVAHFLSAVGEFGIVVRGFYGPGDLSALAERHGLAYLGAPPRPTVANIARKRAARAPRGAAELTERARSLEADFAGARADIARRRARGEPSVPRPVFGPPSPSVVAAPVAPPPVEPVPSTLYHRGSLRGGKSLTQLGTIVVVGDVNPGAELVATGDIVVFGALRGTVHAGAQGDASARVVALELAPTQLRIATLIAADFAVARPHGAEVAFIAGERIAVAPLEKAGVW